MTIEDLDKEIIDKPEGVKKLRFYNDNEGYKVEGYCLSRGIDDVNDIITSMAFDTMINSMLLNPVLLDEPNYIPVGKVINFELDGKGLKIVALLTDEKAHSIKENWEECSNYQFMSRIKVFEAEHQDITIVQKRINFIQKFELLSVSLIPILEEGKCHI